MQNSSKSNENAKNSASSVEIKVTDDVSAASNNGGVPANNNGTAAQSQAQKLIQNSTTTTVLDHPSLTAALLQAAKDLQANNSNTDEVVKYEKGG